MIHLETIHLEVTICAVFVLRFIVNAVRAQVKASRIVGPRWLVPNNYVRAIIEHQEDSLLDRKTDQKTVKENL